MNKYKTSWVSNAEADKIIQTVQESLRSGKKDHIAMKRMMDLIVCVKDYNIANMHEQGVISRMLSKENLYRNKSSLTHYGYDINDMVSIFWEEVFKKLEDAHVTGTDVEVRKIDASTEEQTVSKNGLNYTIRKTSCNPIHWLRSRGIMAVRNAISKSYGSHLYVVCKDCGGTQSVVTTTEDEKCKTCPVCKSTDTTNIFPDGHSSYKSKKHRKCNKCDSTWDRKFEYKCYRCGSDNVTTETNISEDETVMMHIKSDVQRVDDMLNDMKFDAEISQLLKDVYRSLPTDPKDINAFTKTHEIFNILVYPDASKDMCKRCVASARRICEIGCNESKLGKPCGHNLIINPADSCGEAYFNDKCVNYSKKIGEYHNCSASLTSRRVKKVREYIKMYIVTHKGDRICRELYGLLKKRGLL